MAVGLCLSPWPNQGTAGETAALAYLKRACAGFTKESDEAARALGQVASARVEREAPNAPQAVKNQAAVRYCGYFAQADFGTIRQETIGPKDTQYVVNHQRAWINCGAKALLSPWKPLHVARVANGNGDE